MFTDPFTDPAPRAPRDALRDSVSRPVRDSHGACVTGAVGSARRSRIPTGQARKRACACSLRGRQPNILRRARVVRLHRVVLLAGFLPFFAVFLPSIIERSCLRAFSRGAGSRGSFWCHRPAWPTIETTARRRPCEHAGAHRDKHPQANQAPGTRARARVQIVSARDRVTARPHAPCQQAPRRRGT